MDQVLNDSLRNHDLMEQVAAALKDGAIVVIGDNGAVWMDETIRRRMNGNLDDFLSSVVRIDRPALVCSISPVEVNISGEPARVCIIREADKQNEPTRDLIAAVEAVMSDTSWFTRTIVEKLKAFRSAGQTFLSSDLDLLTEREREVLGLICEGLTDPEMGNALGLSQNTIRNHIAALYRKIGVNRRSAAIIWARERAITSQEALDVKGRKRRSLGAQKR